MRLRKLQFLFVITVAVAVVITALGVTSKEKKMVGGFHRKAVALIQVKVLMGGTVTLHSTSVFQQAARAKFIHNIV